MSVFICVRIEQAGCSVRTAFNDRPYSCRQGNDIVLQFRHRAQQTPQRQPISFEVRLTEDAWTRQDRTPATREHLMMALADLDYIMIKNTYTASTAETRCVGVRRGGVGVRWGGVRWGGVGVRWGGLGVRWGGLGVRWGGLGVRQGGLVRSEADWVRRRGQLACAGRCGWAGCCRVDWESRRDERSVLSGSSGS